MIETQITPHDHVAEAQASVMHPASPVYRRGHQEMILTRRGWRTVTHLTNLLEACNASGSDPVRFFRVLGLI